MIKKLVSGGLAGLVLLSAATAPAFADHTHVKKLGNGECVILAQNGGEKHVNLPDHLVGTQPENRQHPLHVLVHLGQPGSDGSIAVLGSAAGDALCAAGYVND